MLTTNFTYTFPLPGWQLVSLPLLTSTNRVSSLFPNAANGVAYLWNTQTGSYDITTTMETSKGYFIYLFQSDTVTISGKPMRSYVTSLPRDGWHAIGSVIDPVDFADPLDKPDSSIVSTYGWDAATGAFQMRTSLMPGQGYWTLATRACELSVRSGHTFLQQQSVVAGAMYRPGIQDSELPPLPPVPLKVNSEVEALPNSFHLEQNHPNPFNPETTIEYALPRASQVRLIIYDMLGQKVRTLVDREQDAGVYEVRWDGKNDAGEHLASGVYLYRLQTPGFTQSRRMVFVR